MEEEWENSFRELPCRPDDPFFILKKERVRKGRQKHDPKSKPIKKERKKDEESRSIKEPREPSEERERGEENYQPTEEHQSGGLKHQISTLNELIREAREKSSEERSLLGSFHPSVCLFRASE